MALVRAAIALFAIAAAVRLEPALAAKAFAGPTGWDHTVGVSPTPQSPRAQETWKKADGQTLTYLSDAALSYDDVVGMVKKNVADNGIKTTVDTDRKCDGRRAHEVEMTFGSTIVRQVIVDDAPGVTKLTYTHPAGLAVAPEVAGAFNTYCAST